MTTITIERVENASRQAVKDTAPFTVALIPFGMAIGAASAAAGFSAWESAFSGVALLAGASQLAAVEVIGSGGGVLATAVVVALINLRFAFYGAAVAQWFADAPMRSRLMLAIPIIDQTFMLCQERFGDGMDLSWRQRYYATATAMLIAAFIGSQVIAFHIGGGLPDSLGLHLAAPLTFAGLLAKTVTSSPALVAGAVAALIVVLGTSVAGAAALPLGVATGVGTALFAGRSRR